jgi:sulfite reductase (NADPH) flavoprotein alpha-component
VLSSEQWEALQRLIAVSTPEQRVWISGYLAGLEQSKPQTTATLPAEPESASIPVTILFGSQTGNSEKLAKALKQSLQAAGHAPRLENMAAYKPAQLKRDRYLLVVVSTYGEGTPPDNAVDFHEFLHGKKAPDLSHLAYAVLGLGDASYEHFCQTGKDFDQRLEALGARRLEARVDCDVDYEEAAEAWIAAVTSRLPKASGGAAVPGSAAPAQTSPSAHSKKHPFFASLNANIPLTGRGSSKEVRHFELNLAGSGMTYEPGDALGVVPQNWPQRVTELLEALRFEPGYRIAEADGTATTLQEALTSRYEISTLTRPFLERYAELVDAKKLTDLLAEDRRTELRDYLHGREILDVVLEFPLPGLTPEQFLAVLRKLPPRLYSIASSLNAAPDEAHLTVAVVRYHSHGRDRLGVASTFLAERVGDDGAVPIYVETNPNFRLPADPDAPIVMIGPGTGVAPFRAFIQEREAIGATGRNWLFFGDRNFQTDFLYQAEWLEYRRQGLLNRIDVAFSRDDEAKVYVQHRLLERSRELYGWLEQGAHVYVCGDAQRMAPDVHEALISVVERQSGLTRERAGEYVKNLQSAKRYQRDVY